MSTLNTDNLQLYCSKQKQQILPIMHCFNGKQCVTVRIWPFFTEHLYSLTELCNDYREKRAIKQIMNN